MGWNFGNGKKWNLSQTLTLQKIIFTIYARKNLEIHIPFFVGSKKLLGFPVGVKIDLKVSIL